MNKIITERHFKIEVPEEVEVISRPDYSIPGTAQGFLVLKVGNRRAAIRPPMMPGISDELTLAFEPPLEDEEAPIFETETSIRDRIVEELERQKAE